MPEQNAQLSLGGTPLKSDPSMVLEWIELDEVRGEELLLEDEWLAVSGKKNNRIATETQVLISPLSHGTWHQLADGSTVWRAGIRVRGARALGLVFSRYVLEKGIRVFLYTPSGENTLGAYSSVNNKSSGYLAVSYLPGEELIVQLEMEAGITEFGELQIGTVRKAYRPVFSGKSTDDGYFGSSGDCNIDVICPEGEDWQVVKNSVVRMINIEKCTGVLINNTANDNKAYVYTAAHCIFQNNKLQPTTFYFNYESPGCNGPDGSTQNSISGYTLLSTGDTLENPRDSDSLDFALLELSINPPESFNAYYAGWYRGSTPAQNTTTIHHPSGDVKKISFDLDPPEVSYHDPDFFPELVRNSHWRVLEWDLATTEFGSSGCPLYDQDQRVIGTLTGGQATCAFQKNDYYTRMDYAWDYYPEPYRQLKHWLDPGNTAVMSMGGRPLNASVEGKLSNPGTMEIYPNPASWQLELEAGLELSANTRVRIYDASGRMALEKALRWPGRLSLDLSSLQEGIYICTLSQDRQVLSSRFLITR